MTETNKRKQLEWQCRRGMLELDVILIPFLKKHFEELNFELQATFSEFLKQEDPDLYTWLMGFGECDRAEFIEIIQLIRLRMSIA